MILRSLVLVSYFVFGCNKSIPTQVESAASDISVGSRAMQAVEQDGGLTVDRGTDSAESLNRDGLFSTDAALSLKKFSMACEKGLMVACSNLYLLSGNLDTERKKIALESSCKGEFLQSCYTIALSINDPTKAKELMQKACRGGFSDACLKGSSAH